MHCTYYSVDGTRCEHDSPDPSGEYDDRCAFHIPLASKENWTADQRNEVFESFKQSPAVRRGHLAGFQLPAWLPIGSVTFATAMVDLSGAEIDQNLQFDNRRGSPVSLKQATIHGSVTIQNCELSRLDLSGVVTDGRTVLTKTVVKELVAEGGQLKGGLTLNGPVTLTDADFTSVAFGAEGKSESCLDCNDSVTFTGNQTVFQDSHFFAQAIFRAVRFVADNVLFSDATFKEKADFSGMAVAENSSIPIRFDRVKFLEGADFRNAQFGKAANFYNITSKGHMNFDGAKFPIGLVITTAEPLTRLSAKFAEIGALRIQGTTAGPVSFESATIQSAFLSGEFGERSSFRNTSFDGLLRCNGLTFSKFADFSCDSDSTIPIVMLSLQNTHFKGQSSFSNRRFVQHADFSGATFDEVPSFFGTSLHPGTLFGGMTSFKDTSRHSIKCYQTLRQQCEALRSRHEEGIFHALEQRAIMRSGDLGRTEKLLSWAYHGLSRYGTSVERASWVLTGYFFGSIALMLAVAWIKTYSPGVKIDWSLVGEAFRITATNVFAPFYLFRQSTGWIALGHFLQSILALPLFATFVLAIRWRFRRG